MKRILVLLAVLSTLALAGTAAAWDVEPQPPAPPPTRPTPPSEPGRQLVCPPGATDAVNIAADEWDDYAAMGAVPADANGLCPPPPPSSASASPPAEGVPHEDTPTGDTPQPPPVKPPDLCPNVPGVQTRKRLDEMLAHDWRRVRVHGKWVCKAPPPDEKDVTG